MKPLVIYHANCTDGFGAAFSAWLALGDEAEYVPMNYNSINPADLADLTDDREVYILDFSLPRVQMESVFRLAKRVVWLDHHKTAFEMWRGKYKKGMIHQSGEFDKQLILLNDNKSGALLAWEYFHPNTEVPMLIQHIDDRDRWQWKLRCSAEIHAALGSMQPWSFEQWEELIQPEHYGSLCTEGAAILRAQDQTVQQIVGHARKSYIEHPHGGDNDWVFVTGLAVNSPVHQSEVGHELANQSGTFGLAWYLAEDNTVRCSFRSNGDYDVSAIARVFGGGGHRNAAGCEVSIETLLDWLK
ncbi:MAG TPA: DHHA1 domain-containing protein [Nitrospira sp.]|nr:DHHA1 domain-containing protein [Nitrospira sp.]HNJ21665.1 DHHA1 domain-containing protein [Nitrospira sp.]HNO34556.1 DHHA1 domain-containing protein [Nitrospira sp.]